jgi:hypothetical protein
MIVPALPTSGIIRSVATKPTVSGEKDEQILHLMDVMVCGKCGTLRLVPTLVIT